MKRHWREEYTTETTRLDDVGTILDGWIEDFKVKVDAEINPANLDVRVSFETITMRTMNGGSVGAVIVMNAHFTYEEEDDA